MPTRNDTEHLAGQTVEHFINLHEPSYRPLLHYAALPLVLTPELLHYLRHTFTPRTPWLAEVDVLLAESLCRQYSTYEQYLMHADVRAYLLKEARARPDFRLAQAAQVLLHYIRDLERTRPYKSWRDLQSQAWSAMVYIDDEHRRTVVEQVKEEFRRAGVTDSGGSVDLMSETELERLAHLTEQLAPELAQYPELVDYARYVRALVRNEPAVGDQAYQPILGEYMPSPAQLTGRQRRRPGAEQPLKVFLSYAHQDRKWPKRLEAHLAPLKRLGLIDISSDREIRAGEDWKVWLEAEVNRADLVLFLISPSFLASELTYEFEMKLALHRHTSGAARLVPIILEPALWKSTPLADLACLPADGLPVASRPDPDVALAEVVGALRPIIEELRARRTTRPSLPPVELIHGWPAERVQELQRQTARAWDCPVEFRERFEDGSQQGPLMVVIPGGRFLMGSPSVEPGRSDDEHQHEVEISPLAASKYPVTFEEYERFCDATERNKSEDQGWGKGTRPVIGISWKDAVSYCEWLSQQTGAHYRLLSEAQWEYASRAGGASRYCFGDDEQRLGDYAWFLSNSEHRTHPVGQKRANAWHLHDMHGNVWEWVQDWYSESYYKESPSENPSGPETGSDRVIRGGSWFDVADDCRSACRDGDQPSHRYRLLGFRLSRTGPWRSYPITLGDRVPPQVAPVPSDARGPSPTPPAPLDDAELQEALAELAEARTRPYYDAAQDQQDRDSHYTDIKTDIKTDVSAKTLFNRLSELVRSTHTGRFKYKPSRHVYPWIDLHPDHKLRSIYSGRSFDPETFIREDFRIAHERAVRMQELILREGAITDERIEQELDFLEASLPYNCEHVVPQSWYAKREPMRGDLHHLFACESGCNSFRSNIPYDDFPDFGEEPRDACGKRIDNDKFEGFEPAAGKGAVARSTLYFMLRYPGQVGDRSRELQVYRLPILLDWHKANPPDEYERHRNAAIFEKQGNRNPLIDHPEWAEKIDFEQGVG